MTDFGFNFLGNVLNIKWKHHGVFRRFALNYEQNKIFEALMKKCNELVPTNDFGLAWIDEEGDPIRIDSEADILLAIQGMNAQLLRIHSIEKDKARPPVEGNAHPGVQCDLCDAFIIGTRFKCILCADYDLCQKCESTGEHKHHAMLRIVDPNETIVPWGGRLRTRPGACPTGERGWRRHHGGGPFNQPGLFDQHHRQVDQARKRMEETREQFKKHMESDEWKKTCKNGLDFLNNVGTQIQQALANFGIDATIESMDIRPPADSEKKDKEKTTEPQQETPMETQNNIHPSNGSDVELLEPTQNLPQEPLQPSAPKEQPHQQPQEQTPSMPPRCSKVIPPQEMPIPSIPISQAIPLPAPQPIPFAVPMPGLPGQFPLHPAQAARMFPGAGPGAPGRFFGAPQQAAFPYGGIPMMPQGPVRDLHVTATLHGGTPTAHVSQTVPDPVPAVDATRVEAREVGDWVIGDVYPQFTQREPLTDAQKKTYEQLIRMGFSNARRAEDAARRFVSDINAAIDYMANLSLD